MDTPWVAKISPVSRKLVAERSEIIYTAQLWATPWAYIPHGNHSLHSSRNPRQGTRSGKGCGQWRIKGIWKLIIFFSLFNNFNTPTVNKEPVNVDAGGRILEGCSTLGYCR